MGMAVEDKFFGKANVLVKKAKKLYEQEKYKAAERKYSQAEKLYLQILEINKGHIMAHIHLADIYAELRKPSESIKQYTESAKLYARDGFLGKAIAVDKRILEINPCYKDAFEHMGEMYERLGMIKKSIEAYQEVLKLDPKCESALDAIAELRKPTEIPKQEIKKLTLEQRVARIERNIGLKS